VKAIDEEKIEARPQEEYETARRQLDGMWVSALTGMPDSSLDAGRQDGKTPVFCPHPDI